MELIVFDMAGTTVQDENKVGLTLQRLCRIYLKLIIFRASNNIK